MLRSPPLLHHSPSFFMSLPVSQSLSFLCSRISDNDIYHGRCHAATAHSFTFSFSFSPLLRQPTLYSSCASRARRPCIQFSIPTSLLQLSHSFKPRTSSVDMICVFTVNSPPSSLRALYRIPISPPIVTVNLCNVFALPYLSVGCTDILFHQRY